MTAKSLEARVEELENLNRKKRKGRMAGRIANTLYAILFVCACWAWASGGISSPGPVTATAFYLQDSSGDSRGGFGVLPGGVPELWFHDDDGRRTSLAPGRLYLSSKSSDGRRSLNLGADDPDVLSGLSVETVSTDPSSGSTSISSLDLGIWNNKGPSLNLEWDELSPVKDTPSLSLWSRGGGAVLDVDRKRGPALNLSTKSGANAAKKVIWSAP
jgi:hypothetical protein